jgi:hypothetical protein
VPKPLLSYLLPYFERSIALVKRLAGSPKGAEIDPNLPHANKSVNQGSTRILIYIDGLSVAPNCAQAAILPSIPERSIALVKRLAGSPKGAEIDPNLPHANKSVTQGSTRILIYIDGLFQSHQLPKRCYLTFFHFPERSIALKDWLVHQKELKLIPTCPTLTKVLLQGSTRTYIHDGSLVAPNCAQAVAILPSSIFPERSIALVNDWLVHQKELKLIPTCPTLTKVLPKVAHAFLYTWMDFFQSHQTVPKPLLSYLLPYSRTFQLH